MKIKVATILFVFLFTALLLQNVAGGKLFVMADLTESLLITEEAIKEEEIFDDDSDVFQIIDCEDDSVLSGSGSTEGNTLTDNATDGSLLMDNTDTKVLNATDEKPSRDRSTDINSFIYGYILDLIPISGKMQGSGITIELIYGKQAFKYKDEYITPANHIVADELHSRKINGSYPQKRQIMDKCLRAGGTYKNAVLFTMPLLEKTVKAAINAINCPATDSTMDFNPDKKPMFTIKREKEGRRVNEENLYRQIYVALCTDANAKITVVPLVVPPSVTAKDNTLLTRLRSSHSTTYANSNANRKHNISLALKKINGTVLRAGEEFSFNKTVGKRGEKNGFKESIIIVGGKYENGVGGGVCQVSTTLYNAALLAGQRITAARSHSLECSYELPSFDAMVNSGSQDLRFKNTDDSSVFIRAYSDGVKAVIEFYGTPMPLTIKRHSEIIYRKDPPPYTVVIDTEYKYHEHGSESGTKKYISYSHGEMKSAGYLLYYDKRGFLVKKEKIREDKYQAVTGLVAIAP